MPCGRRGGLAHNPVTPQYRDTVRRVNGHSVWTGRVNLAEHKLSDPLRWRSPRMVFVNSMSDLFHESVPDAWIVRVFAVMRQAPQHAYQVLTKRPERVAPFLARTGETIPDCCWLGVSVERQDSCEPCRRAAGDRGAGAGVIMRAAARSARPWS